MKFLRPRWSYQITKYHVYNIIFDSVILFFTGTIKASRMIVIGILSSIRVLLLRLKRCRIIAKTQIGHHRLLYMDRCIQLYVTRDGYLLNTSLVIQFITYCAISTFDISVIKSLSKVSYYENSLINFYTFWLTRRRDVQCAALSKLRIFRYHFFSISILFDNIDIVLYIIFNKIVCLLLIMQVFNDFDYVDIFYNYRYFRYFFFFLVFRLFLVFGIFDFSNVGIKNIVSRTKYIYKHNA